ncbi:hypothetical protein OHU17_37875 (plasmid) [Streptomyces goshikiensis]|uniref:Uncharacterized protein n=1 Tax=Streptomyces goshikiensis TaxID=1942 RepID=A0ABZ1RYB2_9ACTN|nr:MULTISPECIES: hypothetical protein [Streptomyces]
MDDALWSRLSPEVRVELDELITSGRTLQAIKMMREHIGPQRLALWDCVEALQERADVLEVSGPIRSRASSE